MSYSQIRAKARDNLTNQWAISIAVALVALLLGGIITGSSILPEIKIEANYIDLDEIDFMEGYGLPIGTIGLVQLVIGGVVQLGYAQFLLRQHDKTAPEFSDLFSQFHRFGQGFAQSFFRGLFVFLWSLLLIVPGIIAGLRYAMTPFVMADHPELSALDAIDYSSKLMEGHKWDLFVLQLTFIGWDLLSALTMNLGNLILNPYKNAATAVFYRELAGAPKITVE